METYRIQNVAKFFGHLLSTDALNWNILACIRLHEEERNSSSQIFIKILFQELCDELGIDLLGKKLNEDSVRDSVAGIFPKDSKRNIQFCINFFTCIGFGAFDKELKRLLEENGFSSQAKKRKGI